jgi:hypothetical protein
MSLPQRSVSIVIFLLSDASVPVLLMIFLAVGMLDIDGDGVITKEELKLSIQQNPQLAEVFKSFIHRDRSTVGLGATSLTPPVPSSSRPPRLQPQRALTPVEMSGTGAGSVHGKFDEVVSKRQ